MDEHFACRQCDCAQTPSGSISKASDQHTSPGSKDLCVCTQQERARARHTHPSPICSFSKRSSGRRQSVASCSQRCAPVVSTWRSQLGPRRWRPRAQAGGRAPHLRPLSSTRCCSRALRAAALAGGAWWSRRRAARAATAASRRRPTCRRCCSISGSSTWGCRCVFVLFCRAVRCQCSQAVTTQLALGVFASLRLTPVAQRTHHTTQTAGAGRHRAHGRRAALPREAGALEPAHRDAHQLFGHHAPGRRNRESRVLWGRGRGRGAAAAALSFARSRRSRFHTPPHPPPHHHTLHNTQSIKTTNHSSHSTARASP